MIGSGGSDGAGVSATGSSNPSILGKGGDGDAQLMGGTGEQGGPAIRATGGDGSDFGGDEAVRVTGGSVPAGRAGTGVNGYRRSVPMLPANGVVLESR